MSPRRPSVLAPSLLIGEGRLANLVAVAGNPLEDVRVLEDVRWVMLGGEVVKERAP